MATKKKDLSAHEASSVPKGKGRKVTVIVSEWNSGITHALRDGAVQCLKKYGVGEKSIRILNVPGTFELTFAAALEMKKGKSDSIICIGCVIQGETPHFDYICQGVANGISELNAEGKVPVIFGVLTTNDMSQARERAGGKHGNKGVEAAVTALKMMSIAGK